MTMVSNVFGATGAYPVSTASVDIAMTTLSPDALLSYCRTQLGAIDDQIGTEMKAQRLALAQRTAVQHVQTVLESFGTKGPETYADLNKCTAAFDTAIGQLGPDDPIARELSTQEKKLNDDYGATPTQQVRGVPSYLQSPASVALIKPPQNDDWKGTTEAVSGLVDGIKGGAELQMLTLQDLVSQRQQAVEQVTAMMSKEDQSLDDGAKAIGQ